QSVVRFRSAPKSLKHSLHTPPSGSVFTSGTLRRTLPVESGPRLAQKAMPAYFDASYGPLGSMRLVPMPEKTMAPVPTVPWKRAANFELWPPSLIAKVPPSSPAGGSTVVVPLSLNVYQYPPRPSFGRFWLFPSSPSSMSPFGPQSFPTCGPEASAAGAAAPAPIDAADPGATCGCIADLSGMTHPSASNAPPATTMNAFFASLFI